MGCISSSLKYRGAVLPLNEDAAIIKNDKNSSEKVLSLAGKMVVYYGSQTGTAETFAKNLAKFARKLGFDAKAKNVSDFQPLEFSRTRFMVLLMSTTGEGSVSHSAHSLYDWLQERSNAKEIVLSAVCFAVFGLGNKLYTRYNAAGKKIDHLMQAVGATRLMNLTLGDDNGDLDQDFDNWMYRVMQVAIDKYHPMPKQIEHEADHTSYADGDPEIGIEFETFPVADSSIAQNFNVAPHLINPSTAHFFNNTLCTIAKKQEMCKPAPDGTLVTSTLHIEVDIASFDISYMAGDSLVMMVENDASVVAEVINRLGFNPADRFSIKGTGAGSNVEDFALSEASSVKYDEVVFKEILPTPCTVQDLFTKYLDINATPRMSLMRSFIPFVADKRQKEWLINLLSKENREQYNGFMKSSYRSFYSLLLKELSSLKLTLSETVHLLPYLQPRLYTIASSPLVHPKSIHITVGMPTDLSKCGVGAKYINGLVAGENKVNIMVRPSQFRLPPSIDTPITMIGPGTGIAPMIGLLQERSYLRKQHAEIASDANDSVIDKSSCCGHTTLYVGCKYSSCDFIYSSDIEGYQSDGTLTQLYTAFSREIPNTKVYVQTLLSQEANALALIDQLEHGGYLYVCGATAMGMSVMDAIVSMLVKYRPIEYPDRDKAFVYIRELQDDFRYIQEVYNA